MPVCSSYHDIIIYAWVKHHGMGPYFGMDKRGVMESLRLGDSLAYPLLAQLVVGG